MSAFDAVEQAAVRHAAAAPVAPAECLSFSLGEEAYGVDLLRVMEIRSFEQPTRIAGAGAQVLGVLNLRGTIVPIIDLRKRFGLDAAYGDDTVTVITTLHGRMVGVVVDSVSDVVPLAPGELKPAPGLGQHGNGRHITGLATVELVGQSQLLILLDLDQLISGDDLGSRS